MTTQYGTRILRAG